MHHMPFADYYRGKRVLVTGSTGFKGSWLSTWLLQLGAEVHGLGLAPDTDPALHSVLELDQHLQQQLVDIRDRDAVQRLLAELRPEVVFHLAAQPLVRRSYAEPLRTLDTNVTGTANLLAAIQAADYSSTKPCQLVVITSDKCYENRETYAAYREDESMGGHDIYSASKGMMELLVSAWRRSFYHPDGTPPPALRVATCRAGNVIGGGDWSADRIVVDCVAALAHGDKIAVRNPLAMRPWQHVLEPLSGYLHLGALLGRHPERLAELSTGFNFGPGRQSERSVGELSDAIVAAWGRGDWELHSEDAPVHEARYLKLAIDKAWHHLAWQPSWDFDSTVREAVAWYRQGYYCRFDSSTMRALTTEQIADYTEAARQRGLAWAGMV